MTLPLPFSFRTSLYLTVFVLSACNGSNGSAPPGTDMAMPDLLSGPDMIESLTFVRPPTDTLSDSNLTVLVHATTPSSNTLTLKLNASNGAMLLGNLNAQQNASGDYVFDPVAIDIPGSGYTLEAGGAGFVSVVSPPFSAHAAWIAQSPGPASSFYYDVLVAPDDSRTVYVADAVGLYKTSNGGNDWSLQSFSGTSFIALYLDAGPANHTYASSGSNVITQQSADTTWAPASPSPFPGGDLQFSTVGNEIYSLVSNNKFAYSVAGAAFVTVDTGLNIDGADEVEMWLDPSTSGATARIYWLNKSSAPPYTGVLRRTDNRGSTWSANLVPCPSPSTFGGALRSDGTLFGLCGVNDFISTNQGVTWASYAPNNLVYEFAFVPGHPNVVFGLAQGGITTSTDGGHTYGPPGLVKECNLPGGGYPCYGMHVSVDPNDANTVWLSLEHVGVFKTTTGGL